MCKWFWTIFSFGAPAYNYADTFAYGFFLQKPNV